MDATPPARRNIELKCRCRDLAAAATAVRTLGAVDAGVMQQVDTYFPVPVGRLKLREIVGVRAELIGYARSDAAEARQSDYRLTPVSHPAELRATLAAALGLRGEVRKRRHLLLWDHVRVHLDDVEGLGSFVEFEAVIDPAAGPAAEADAHARLDRLCGLLSITPADYQTGSYADLLRL